VNIRYFNALAYEDGWYSFVFPMVVGPRFNPPGSTDGVGAVARGKPSLSGQSTEVQYLRPNERSGHDIDVAVAIDAGVPIEKVACNSHRIKVANEPPGRCTVALAADDRIPNKDFVLRYRVTGEHVKSGLITHRDERGGFFTLMLYPPAELGSLQRHPMEMVFVLDCSGSMSGDPIAKVKDAIDYTLGHLTPADSFQVIRFSNNASQLGAAPLPGTWENVRRARSYVESLHGSGGTMMIEGIKAALDFPHDDNRLRFVCFMTDGYIGNEAEILGAIHQKLGPSRIFSFGVGSSPNAYLLEGMARAGRGAVAYVGLHDDSEDIMDHFWQRASRPALTDVKIDYGSMRVDQVFPRRLPDLFVGRPIILTGRFEGELPDSINVIGRAGGEPVELAVAVNPDDRLAKHPALPAVWARMQIAELSDSQTRVNDPHGELVEQITHLALDYKLMSAYTAFVAVDASERTAGDHGTTVHQAVPVPEGVRYDTTVME